jgi:hypothetical protein
LQDTPKFTQISIFGLKKWHLATLFGREVWESGQSSSILRRMYIE